MKFDKLRPGMVLYDVHSYKMGRTTMRSIGVWPVRVVSVDAKKREAMCSWNGNPATAYYERGIAKLKEREPILIRTRMSGCRLPTKDERKAILAEGIKEGALDAERVRHIMARPANTDSVPGRTPP